MRRGNSCILHVHRLLRFSKRGVVRFAYVCSLRYIRSSATDGIFFATLLTEAAMNLSFELKWEREKKRKTQHSFSMHIEARTDFMSICGFSSSFFISNSLTFSAMLITLEQRQDCPFSLVISTWYYQQVSPKGKYSWCYSRNQRCLSLAKNLFICSMRQQERMQRTFRLRTTVGEVNCQRERVDLSTRLMTVDL